MRIREIIVEDRAQIELMIAMKFGRTIESLVVETNEVKQQNKTPSDLLVALQDINYVLLQVITSDIWDINMQYDIDRAALYTLASSTYSENEGDINKLLIGGSI